MPAATTTITMGIMTIRMAVAVITIARIIIATGIDAKLQTKHLKV